MIVTRIDDIPPLRNPVVTIGIFDGVHLGHRYILEELNKAAARTGGESVLLTLWPHPRLVLDEHLEGFRLLHTKEEKIGALEACGIDRLVVVPFSTQVAALPACEFIEDYLVHRLGVKQLILGHDNRFGQEGKDEEGLQRCAAEHQFQVVRLPEFKPDSGRVSSTVVRKLLMGGAVEEAALKLGTHYTLSGHIVEGNRIGRKIGFPTANVHPKESYKLIPMNGVYAIEAELSGRRFGGMLNIGFRPTLDSATAVKTIEAHLFDVSGDFYGEQVVLHFIGRLRDEMKFSGLDALKAQLARDGVAARQLLRSGAG